MFSYQTAMSHRTLSLAHVLCPIVVINNGLITGYRESHGTWGKKNKT